VAPEPPTTYQPDRPLRSTPNSSSGAAWAKLNAPDLATPIGWDKASIEARVDPRLEQGKIGTTLSHSLPITRELMLTLQNSYVLTETWPSAVAGQTSTVGNGAALATTGSVTSSWATERLVRLNILSSGTSFSAGAKLSSTDDKWLRSLSAEQKLFGGPFSITGSANETATGEIARSITAGFKHSW